MGAVDDMLEYLSGVADNLGLEDDERDSFINSSMARKGFKQTASWTEPDEGNKGGGDFFSGGRRESRNPNRPRGNRNSGGGFTQYQSG